MQKTAQQVLTTTKDTKYAHSLVRKLGTKLPLGSAHRIYFQVKQKMQEMINLIVVLHVHVLYVLYTLLLYID